MPFDDDDNFEPSKKGIKLNNNKSALASGLKKPNPEEFKKIAGEILEKKNNYKERATDLAVKFKSILQDKTLVENKNSISLDIEKEVIDKLLQLAQDINNDENEPESYGSVAAIAIIIKSLFYQRDRINSIEYRVERLEKEMKNIFSNLSISDEKK